MLKLFSKYSFWKLLPSKGGWLGDHALCTLLKIYWNLCMIKVDDMSYTHDFHVILFLYTYTSFLIYVCVGCLKLLKTELQTWTSQTWRSCSSLRRRPPAKREGRVSSQTQTPTSFAKYRGRIPTSDVDLNSDADLNLYSVQMQMRISTRVVFQAQMWISSTTRRKDHILCQTRWSCYSLRRRPQGRVLTFKCEHV